MIIQGDSLSELKKLEPESVDCVVTSPPYWGLRDYGHEDQLGLESDFQDYIIHLADIFDEVWRVLKPTGTVWINLGDTYGGRVGGAQGKNGQFAGRTVTGARIKHERPLPKSMLQIPSRFAIEMSTRGWILRNELIWHKPNSMPQSVRDRFTVDYEKIFLFVKSPVYYFEQQFEPWVQRPNDIKRASEGHTGYSGKHSDGKSAQGIKGQPVGDPSKGRNKRSIWTVSTKPYKGAHFAVYPPELIAPMIKAGCPRGGGCVGSVFRLGDHRTCSP
jgi:DNA modification methylase